MGSNFPSESFSSSSTEETHSHFWALVISQSGRASSVASHPSTRFLVFTMATMKLSFWRVYRYIACSSWSFISRRKHEWEGCEALPLCDHTHAMWCAEQNLLWNDKLECIFFPFLDMRQASFTVRTSGSSRYSSGDIWRNSMAVCPTHQAKTFALSSAMVKCNWKPRANPLWQALVQKEHWSSPECSFTTQPQTLWNNSTFKVLQSMWSSRTRHI